MWASELDLRGFELGVLVEGVERLIATVARLLEAPKSRGHVAAECFQLARARHLAYLGPDSNSSPL
ncbi:hypothetical protein D3C85_506420 [compost metagenome]